MSSLRPTFNWVLRELFPRWSAGPGWRVRRGGKRPWHHPWSFADRGGRTIWMASWLVQAGGADLKAQLVHECCHAVTGGSHGRRWIDRMIAASKQARRSGDVRLSVDLMAHVNLARQAPTTEREIHAFVEDAANQGLSYVESVQRLCCRMNTGPSRLRGMGDLRATHRARAERRAELFEAPARIPTVVLDTNAASYLIGCRNFSNRQLSRLRRILREMTKAGELQIPLSIPLITELAGLEAVRPDLHTKLVRCLTSLSNGLVLRDYLERLDIELTSGRRLLDEECFVRLSKQEILAACLSPAAAQAAREHVRTGTAEYAAEHTEAREAILDRFDGDRRAMNRLTREWYADPEAVVDDWCRDSIRRRARRAGLPKSEFVWPAPRELPSLWYFMSFHIARIYLLHAENRRIDGNDLYDHVHFESAAYADTLVTSDGRFIRVADTANLSDLTVKTFDEWATELLEQAG